MTPEQTSTLKFSLARAVLALSALLTASAGHAGNVQLFSYNGFIPPDQRNQSGPGFVTAQVSHSAFFGNANAYEFLGGAGASAFATSRQLNMQAQASASFSQGMTARCPVASGCTMLVSIQVDGSTSASGTANPGNPNQYGSAQGAYNFNWSLTGPGVSAAGFAVVDHRFNNDGTSTLDIQGSPFSRVFEITVRDGDRLSLGIRVGAGAFTDNFGPATGFASGDISGGVRWGGVSSASVASSGMGAMAGLASSAALDLSQVSLLGDDGFDYINAAPPNPYLAAVPEPASWLLCLAGVAALLARRKRSAV